MSTTDNVAYKIDRFPTNCVFTYTDFKESVKCKEAVIKALNRMVATGKIAKLSKGKFFKPRRTVFGQTQPPVYQIVKDLLKQNGESIGYITGYNAYNELGLTTQIPATLQIGTNKYRRPITRGIYKISFVQQPNKITKTNIELLRILDAIRFIREIPATTPDEATTRLMRILKSLSTDKLNTMSTLVLKYAPSVRALCGALLNNINTEESLLNKISNSLNPISEYNIPISDTILPNKKEWRIK